MSVEVLQTKSEIATAREQMRGLNIDCKSPSWLRWAVRLRLSNSIIIGEFNKSWDVFKTVSFLKTNLAPGDPILDIGAHTSETLFCLHRLGFSRLTGVDLNPGIMQMPHAGEITYIRSDFMHIRFRTPLFQRLPPSQSLSTASSQTAFLRNFLVF